MSYRTRTTASLRASLFLIATSIAATHAAPIITPNGVPSSGIAISSAQFVVQSFTLGDAWNNVAISAALASFSSGQTGTAYLTNQFGAGTTLANQIATANFTFIPAVSPETLVYVNLFSGLTLSPGTYYLTFASTVAGGNQGITTNPAMTFTTASGVTVGSPQHINTGLDGLFPPASTGALGNSTSGNRFFTVTGDLATSQIPEPSTVLLISAGLLATVTLRRKSR